VRFDSKTFKNVLDVTDEVSFYSNRFDEAYDGNCFYISYELDYDIPENSYENVEANGYYWVSIFDKIDVDRWSISSMLTDTSNVLTDEVALIDAVWDGAVTYLKGKAFIISSLQMPVDQEMYWNLSYDSDNMTTDEFGQKYYNVYLRSTIRRQGTKSKERVSVANAFEMKNYMEEVAKKEKELGHHTFKIRFNYPSVINEDGQITWDHQDARDFYVEQIIPEE
jgi:hypothetical protein